MVRALGGVEGQGSKHSSVDEPPDDRQDRSVICGILS